MTEHGPDIDLSRLPSPCFVLDERKLIKNLRLLKRIREEAGIKILVALKGYAMWSTFPLLRQYLDGATASSLHEAMLCHKEMGIPAHLCAPVYIADEFDTISSVSSHITFNSLGQFEKFGKAAMKKGLKIALRINPEYSEVTTDLYNPCVPGSRLGITIEQMPEELPEGVTGLHFHTLCEQDAGTLVRTLAVVEKKFGKYFAQISWLNIGGGHHFTRKDYDIDLFIKTVMDFRQKYGLEVIAEPGEAIGWQTGWLVSTVQDIVSANGFTTAMLDASFAAHMPDCLEMPYKPAVLGESAKPTDFAYRLGGNTCLAGDFIGPYYFEHPLEPGDKMVFDDMIHYTMVKTNTFNGVKLPAIAIIRQNGKIEIIREFGYQDFKSRLS